MFTIRAALPKPSNPRAKKVVNRRKDELKSIQKNIKKIADDERKRALTLWEDHKDLFKTIDEEEEVIDVQPIKDVFNDS